MRHRASILAVSTALLPVGAAWADFGDFLFKLLPNDGARNDHFGQSVAISDTVVIVGADGDDDNGSGSGSAYLMDPTTGNQLFKLLPSDGVAGDDFGYSVAISGTTAIVGASRDDVNGPFSGSAYLFDATTGQQLAKLIPNDGAENDSFGFSVAISPDSIGIAIVGAYLDDDNGVDSGSAYVFDINTGQQLFKLLADDGAADDQFGRSVAISGTTVVVGSYWDDDNGNKSGSAYVFDASTGQQVGKILPNDGAADDNFGTSVAVSDSIAIIGADRDGDNGLQSGSAYLFDTTTGQQLFKLLASDGAAIDLFGISVGINGPTAIVGASEDDDNARESGSAYLFDTATGQQLAKLVPSDGDRFDRFGKAVAISRTTAIGGTRLDDDNGSASGSAYLFNVDLDSDDDGLLDDWEINGIPYVDQAGNQQRFVLPGADPMHKNLYVEVDAMAGFGLSNDAVALLVDAFSNAPLTNPDGFSGITLDVLIDETDLPRIRDWQTNGCWPLSFDTSRARYYGTPGEQGDPAGIQAKAKAYRYCIVADRATPDNIGGCGQRPGDNFVIFLGSGYYNAEGQAAVFMHELGHNLGLRHGGGDNINGKTNYPSVMNYLLSYRAPWNDTFWTLDFSRPDAGSFTSLNETSLNETIGIGTPGGFYDKFRIPFGVNELDEGGNTVRRVKYARLNGSMNDFGDTNGTMFQDGNFDSGVDQDLNFAVDPPPRIKLPGVSSFPQTLDPFYDWANVSLPLAAALGDGAPAPSFADDELATESRDWINVNFPLPPGLAITITGVNVTTGALLDGDVLELIVSDELFVHARSGFGSTLIDLHNMEVIVSAMTTAANPTTLDLTIESHISETAGTVQVRLLNHTTSQFDLVGSNAIGSTDTTAAFPGIDATNYVDGAGNIDVSIKHLVFVPFLAFTFESFIDQVEILVQ